jgi:leucyl aminopeptidase
MDAASMNYRAQAVATPAIATFSVDLLMLVITPDHARTGLAAIDHLLDDATQMGDFSAKDGQTLYIHRPAGLAAGRLAVAVAAGSSPRQIKAAMVKLMGLTQSAQGVTQAAFCLAQGLTWTAQHATAVVCAAEECLYLYRLTKPSAPKPRALKSVALLCDKDSLKAVHEGLLTGQAVGQGVALAREMGNRPGNYCTPTDLADEARRMGKAYRHIKVEVLDRKAIEKIGMGSFLSVTNGSAQPPRFIIMRYEGAAKSQAPVVLVGKGITFDTGGISLKPGAEMDEMKFDMGGAASVLGTFRAVAELQPKLNVIGLIPTCENMPSGTATKPGDVVTSLSGQTIEVLNTDAEGRLILCDALTYAERFKPAVVVDIATLTGACVIALGAVHSGLFSPDDELAAALQQAGSQALDTAWRMPVDDEYGEALKSNFADLGNVGGRAGGAVTAAVFLSKFTKAYRWAHLDIAGTAWKSGAAKGATGRPVGLLTQFLLSQQGTGALKAASKPSAAGVSRKAPAKSAKSAKK